MNSGRGEGVIDRNVAKAMRTLVFSGGIYSQESYSDAHKFERPPVSSDVVITWEDPSPRFDRLNVMV